MSTPEYKALNEVFGIGKKKQPARPAAPAPTAESLKAAIEKSKTLMAGLEKDKKMFQGFIDKAQDWVLENYDNDAEVSLVFDDQFNRGFHLTRLIDEWIQDERKNIAQCNLKLLELGELTKDN